MNSPAPLPPGPVTRHAMVAAALAALLIGGLLAAGDGSGTTAGRLTADPAPPRAGGRQAARTGAHQAARRRGAGAAATGMPLLTQAAMAARATSYRGTQVLTWQSPAGAGAWLGSGLAEMAVQAWHHTVSGPDASAWPVLSQGSPGGVLGVSPALLPLLRRHYRVIYAGTGSASGRPAEVVEAIRRSGTLAARFWLDSRTKLPLRRELFDPAARLISDDRLDGLRLGAPPPAAAPAAAFRPWPDLLGQAQRETLRASGWPVPARMPGGLTLLAASASAQGTGRVIDLAYSDGLCAVSVFVQRGHLPARLPGWRRADLRGHRLFVRNLGEPNLAWSARGFVFTVVAAAPAAVIDAVVNALPRDAPPGFWCRVGRGLRRLLSWI